jgi:hypothetical protein
MTMEFNNKYSPTEPKNSELLPQITGTLTTEYTENNIIFTDIPSRKISIHGKEREWKGINETVSYVLLGCTDSTVAIKYSLYNTEFISQLYFQDKNTYWEYLGNTNPVMNAHSREYFVREETPNKSLKDAP